MQFHMLGIFLLIAAAHSKDIARDSITPWEILQQNGGLVVKQCPGQEGTLHVNQIMFNMSTMAVQVSGTLTNELTDGHIAAKLTVGEAPPDATRLQRMKRKMAWSWNHALSGKERSTEPLCSNQRKCPITTGAQQLNFAFAHLPKLIIAGGYHMQLHAYDQKGGLVVCMEGALSVSHGKHGEVIRVLEDCVNVKANPKLSADGDEQCYLDVILPNRCDTAQYQNHIDRYCKKACGRCQVAEAHSEEASDAQGSHVLPVLSGFLAATLYSLF